MDNLPLKKVPLTIGNSVVFNINYHIVFCPKYRKSVLVDKIKDDLTLIFRAICESNSWILLNLTIMQDHVHFFISSHPKDSPTTIVKKLKGISARLIFKKYPYFKAKEYWGSHLWSTGYYIGTAGVVTSEAIQKYISANSSDQ